MPGTRVVALVGLGESCGGQVLKSHYRLVVMGSAKVGKTAIIQQFLYDTFPTDHCATVEELYRSEYELGGCDLMLDILDTSGSYEFPAMRRLAITTADAFILVYSIDNQESFEEVRRIRETIMETRSTPAPIVVVGNKSDVDPSRRAVKKEMAESVINLDWENGFVEASAKENYNILEIFKALLVQAHLPYNVRSAMQNRRRSLPAFPTSPCIKHKAMLKRNSCVIC